MNRAQERWHRLRCLVRCISQFALLGANQSSAGELPPFEPQSWHRHKLERFQQAYEKDQEHRTDVDLKLLMEIVQSVHAFSHASYTSKLYFCRHMHVASLHDGQVVYHQGDAVDGAAGGYLILQGVVSTYKNSAYESDVPYPVWHQATFPNDDVHFGTCVHTATTGDVFGEAALSGSMRRQTTVLAQSSAKVAVLSQNDYRRVLMYNDVTWTPQQCLYTIETEPHNRTPRQVRDLSDFLVHFHFFRSLPRDVVEALGHRLRHRTFKAHEVLSRQGDLDPPLVIVVAGKVQLFMQDSAEESTCRLLGPQPTAPTSGTTTKKSGANAAMALADKQEYDPALGWCVGELGGGECFGEQAMASRGAQSATLRSAYTTAAIVLYHADVVQVLAQHDRVDPPRKPGDELAHLMTLLAVPPLARSPAAVRDVAKALRQCDASLFFRQLGHYAVDVIAQEAMIRVIDAGTIVLQQDQSCNSMYVILNGSVNIHRLTVRRKQRRQSSLIRMALHQHNHHADDTVSHDGEMPLASLGGEIFDNCGQYLSSMGVGGAFGHVPILTNSHSQSSYVVARNLTKGTVSAALLCIPGRLVAPLVQKLDDSLLYNPRQVLDQATKPKSDTHNTFKLANFLSTTATFAALPHRTLVRVLESMQVVDVPFNHLLWDQGERLGNGVVVVLSGTVLVVQSGHRPPALVDPILKVPESGRLVLHVGRTANTVTLMNSHDQVRTYGPGDCIGSMRLDDTDNGTSIKQDTAMTLSDCKVAIVQWPRVYAPQPPVAKLCHDLLGLRATHLKRQLEQQELGGPPLGPSSDDMHAATGHLLSAIEWKDKFPVRVQGSIAAVFAFATYSAREMIFSEGDQAQALYIIVSGHVNIWIRRRSRSHSQGPARKDVVGRRGWQEGRLSASNSKDDLDPMKAIQALSKEKPRTPTHIERLLTSRRVAESDSSSGRALGELEARLGPGDVLSEKALFHPGIRHRVTAEAATEVTALVLPRTRYEHLLLHGPTIPSTAIVVARNSSERAREHWKLVIHYIVKNRSQRSHWPCVIEFARQKRIRLVMDIVKHVPVFQAMDVALRMRICERTLFQTLAPNYVVHDKGKPVERFFVVVSGSVDLIHVTSSGPMEPSALASITDTNDSALVKIRTVHEGEWFGEYEIVAQLQHRQILAVTTSEGAHVVGVYKGEFLMSWPTLAKMNDRLAFLRQSDALGALEDDRLCSIWYGIRKLRFRCNDVVVPTRSSGAKVVDAIYLIEEGECVVQSQATLVRAVKEARSHEKDVQLDVQVARLTRGNILYCEDTTWKPRTSVIASSQLVQALVLTYPSHSSTIHRIVGKRGQAALRRIMRMANDFQHGQREAAKELAIASEPKPIDSMMLPLLKCVPIARVRGNRVKLPNFLLQRHVPPSSTIDRSNDVVERDAESRRSAPPTTTDSIFAPTSANPHKLQDGGKSACMNGSFGFTAKTTSSVPSATQFAPPHCFSPLETAHVLRPKIRLDETENSSVRLQRALNQQIRDDTKLVQDLRNSAMGTKQSQARLEEQVRIKHGRPVQCPISPCKPSVASPFDQTLQAHTAPRRARQVACRTLGFHAKESCSHDHSN
ncbi:hypothetical protein, variant 1 [Aphanomyces invadans]|uniref:Cyclic nucleotide-binding domain-containing protein n=1 Tax=Aphanomyces invadans TaxID=157072 RepID=A0A024U5E0_9STRA|nr:hypothetical protein, variant 1 [Aphanomyces invadans]ETW01117.1 hypothetical protein, variant 1 [Aphanomyces invadans]|eukprot:XP_008870115.1 hypothetical protein, variant 1 [Aphanomyces invadans]